MQEPLQTAGFEGLRSFQVHTFLPLPEAPPGKTGLLAPLTLDEVDRKAHCAIQMVQGCSNSVQAPSPLQYPHPTPSGAHPLLYQSRALVSSRVEGPAPGGCLTGHWKDQDLTGSPAGTFHCHNHTVPSGKGLERKQLVDCAPGFPYREHTSKLHTR